MIHATRTDGGVVELARVALDVIDELLDVAGRKVGARHQHQVANRQLGDRHEVLDRVVGNLGIQALVQAVRPVGCHQKGVAVSRAFGHKVGGDDFIGPRLVVHDEGLTPAVTQLLADGTHHHVGRTAGAVRHNDADRFGWVGLGLCNTGACQAGQSDQQHRTTQ